MNVKSVSVSDSFSWISNTFSLIKAQWKLWALTSLVLILCFIALGFINQIVTAIFPKAGIVSAIISITLSILIGAFSLMLFTGTMSCVKNQTDDELFSVGQLFIFSDQYMKFIKLQILFTLLFIVLALIIGLVVYLTNLSTFLLINIMLAPNLKVIFIILLLFFIITIPLSNILTLAATLVALNDISPWSALKLSFHGCFKNLLTLFVYSFVLGLLILIMGLIVGFIGSIFVKMGAIGSIIAILIILPATLLIFIFAYISVYQPYNEMFEIEN